MARFYKAGNKNKKQVAQSQQRQQQQQVQQQARGRLRGQQQQPAGPAADLTPSPRGRAGGSVGAAKPRQKKTAAELKLRGPNKGSTASKRGKDGKVPRDVSDKARRARARKVTGYAKEVMGYNPESPLESPDHRALVNAKLLPPRHHRAVPFSLGAAVIQAEVLRVSTVRGRRSKRAVAAETGQRKERYCTFGLE